MKKSGFTLIELLAIIIILGLIIIITVPKVNNVIEDSKKNVAIDSAYGYKRAIHQLYLDNSANNSDFNFDGEYDIVNGVLKGVYSTYNISTDGSVPQSGNITIRNGELFNGCIYFGNYSVIVENGNILDAYNDVCYNTSYYTYDSNSSSGFSDKSSSPNANWSYYIKEFEYPNKYRYGIWDNENNSFVFGYSFPLLANCQSVIDSNYDEDDYECRVIENYKRYYVCGVQNGDTYCLLPGKDNFNYNYNILNEVYGNCVAVDDRNKQYFCDNDNIFISYDTFIGTASIGACQVSLSNSSTRQDYYSVSCE